MSAVTIAEWRQELQRRLERAALLVELGLPDPSFDLLTFEIWRFKARRAALQTTSCRNEVSEGAV